MLRNWRRIISVGMLLIGVSAGRVSADDHAEKTLKGLTGVNLVVADIGPISASHGLSCPIIERDVLAVFRVNRIKVLPRPATNEPRQNGNACLSVNLKAREAGEQLIFALEVSLSQTVTLERDPAISAVAKTWSMSCVDSGDGHKCRNAIKQFIRQFAQAFHQVNGDTDPDESQEISWLPLPSASLHWSPIQSPEPGRLVPNL